MMKRWSGLKSIVLASPVFLAACGTTPDYTPKTLLLPPHIRNIALRPFENKTRSPRLESKLMLTLSQEFLRDGRLSLLTNEKGADGIVTGDIARYIKEPISYDSNQMVEEYKLWVVMDIRFVDQVDSIVLWEEPRLAHEYRYIVETKPGGQTEEQAREALWRLFAKDIVKRTIEGFGSVSGASERKIQSHPPGEAPH